MACESLRVEQVDANILDGEYRQLMEQQFERFVAELPITVSRVCERIRPEIRLLLDGLIWTSRVYRECDCTGTVGERANSNRSSNITLAKMGMMEMFSKSNRVCVNGIRHLEDKNDNETAAEGASPGQVEVDISYKDYPRKKILLHFVLSIFLPYMTKRAESLLEHSTAIKFVSKTAAMLETIHILHYLNFLRVGGYSSLTESFLKLRNWNMHPPTIGTINYESQNRELLWHTFRDALLLLWPAWAVISAKWKSRSNHGVEQANVVALSCGRCGQSAVAPMRASGCGHIACYWCVMSRMPAESARCATCGEETLHVTPVRGHAFL